MSTKKNYYYLFLDDERMPNDVTWINLPKDHPWNIVRTFESFKKFITENGIPDFVSFDHDLADFSNVDGVKTEKTGVDCARWLVSYCIDNNEQLPQFSVHSKNPIRAKEISMTMSDYFKIKEINSRGPNNNVK